MIFRVFTGLVRDALSQGRGGGKISLLLNKNDLYVHEYHQV
jgi:hypothetical protein